jgi:signal transduction histidine kinase
MSLSTVDGPQDVSGTEKPDDLEKVTHLLQEWEQNAKLLLERNAELIRENGHLRALDQSKTDFVSVATHQLRTPLSAIKWTLSMLLKGDMGPLTPHQKDFLMRAYESNNRMVALLSDMLLSDQIQSGKVQMSKETTPIPELPDNLLLELAPIADKRQVKLSFEHPAASYAPVSIDPRHLRAVLQNLLENAIKYSQEGGTVTLHITEEGQKTIFTVSDGGIGIPVESQKNIFNRFFRAPNAVKMVEDGSGLGLFIVKSILDTYKGTIEFKSEESKGATFVVSLPNASIR